VFLETGVFVNALLVREGLARVSAREQLSRINELTRAEGAARSSRRGMWGQFGSSERYVVPRIPGGAVREMTKWITRTVILGRW
jgi:endonuclease YncB( thermonuclease family)